MNASELNGADLDRCVARAAQLEDSSDFRPSVRWDQGGPLIEENWIDISTLRIDGSEWQAVAQVGDDVMRATGPTPLVAAMRAFVASKLGKVMPAV